MSVINTQPLIGASGNQGVAGYNLTKSLRFRSAASAYLTRSPASASNRKTWTFSTWVKRGSLSTDMLLLSVGSSDTARTLVYIDSANTVSFLNNAAGAGYVGAKTNAVLRDPSAWYHIIYSIDTTQATAANRVKLYINGVQQTTNTVNIPQNEDTYINTGGAHYIGRSAAGQSSTDYFDGYLAENHFIDGQALTPPSFGETDTITGVWKPKRYTGTYGTNGFYLPFTDVATTSGSNAGLGKDFSGNGNYWTTNNISVTSGATYDSMTDVPTLTSATAANYAVLNPLRPNGSASLVNGNLGVTPSGTYCNGLSTIQLDSGSYYAECTVTTAQAMGWGIWLNSASTTANVGTTPTGFYGIYSGGATLMINGTTPYTNAGASPSNGDIVQVAWSNGKVWFGKNNTWYDSTFGTTGNPSAGTNATVSSLSNDAFSIAFCGANASPVLAVNFGQRPFAYTPPTGFKALNTFNLPDSTIVAGNKVMDATTFTGNASGATVTNAAGFKPDLVWMKNRSVARNNELLNSVAGGSATLFSNLTNAEATDQRISSFNSNGFTYTSNSNSANTGEAVVAWQWQAGQGTNTTNTSGSITSTVSVNATAGFSIVTYTGTGAAATIGHGLGVAPKFIIVKQRSASGNYWIVYTSAVASPATSYLYLNATSALGTGYGGYWNSTSPTSSVISIGNDQSVNASGYTYVAYCWSEIAGFSKFGSYTGNGSTDGPFVYTGFRPRYIMVKRTDSIGAWEIYDTSRSLYNVAGPKDLQADSSGAENASTITHGYDFLSNGFKTRDTTSYLNTSGATYVYAAFAENPFKNSLAR